MSFFFNRTKRKVSSSATFRLTQEGREKLQEYTGDPKSQILTALETHGTSNLDEISQESGLSRGQVERLIPQLVKGGYIQSASIEAGDDE